MSDAAGRTALGKIRMGRPGVVVPIGVPFGEGTFPKRIQDVMAAPGDALYV